ncbi:MAG: hypothetical protein QW570_08340 [Candidatus Caldarchaeum sp.]
MKMLIPWGKAMGVLTLLAVIGFGLRLGGTQNPQPVEENPRVPAVLKVCMGCTYGSIQAAIDAAQPGDTVEVHLPSYVFWPPIPMQPWWIEKVTISKPLTLEAKPFAIADISLEVAVLSSGDPIFDVTAETGQVTIRGFVLMGGGVSWSGKADLLLEHNRFESFGRRWFPRIELQGSPGQAVLQNNEINEGGIEIVGAKVSLLSNRIKGGIRIVPDYSEDQPSEVVIDHNSIEGNVIVGRGNYVRLEDNILMEFLSPINGQSAEIGLNLEGSEGRFRPSVIEVNRNVIIRYKAGVAIGSLIRDQCEGALPGELELSGQDNVIEQNVQDLCPADHPWPPGFRK